MLHPMEGPPPSRHPRFAASMTPGPPPVMTASPARASSCPTCRACSYSGSSREIRADPNTLIAGLTPSQPIELRRVRLQVPEQELLEDSAHVHHPERLVQPWPVPRLGRQLRDEAAKLCQLSRNPGHQLAGGRQAIALDRGDAV